MRGNMFVECSSSEKKSGRNFMQLPDFQCDPGEARTLDPLIKSQLLYQLSYGVMFCADKIKNYLHKTW